MKKYYFAIALLSGFAVAPAQASPLSIVFDSPTLTGAPGDVVTFSGTISNASGGTVFLNGVDFTLAGFDPSAIDNTPFFTFSPLSLDDGTNSGDIDLFTITIPSLFPLGNYGGTFNISGGLLNDSQDPVGAADFTVQVQEPSATPEPGPAAMLSAGLLLLLGARRLSARRIPAIARHSVLQ